jgi:hypothetical protein
MLSTACCLRPMRHLTPPSSRPKYRRQKGRLPGSVVQQEGSEVARSAQASTAETPVEYSTDFENSSAQAEVFKVHD